MDEYNYSAEAKAAGDLFASDLATHIFYVEDSSAEIFYERLFLRMFPKLKDYSVVCLHGKSNVVKKSQQARRKNLEYVFLVDKDFDDLLSGPQPGLTYLDRYSIENYLADLEAAISVLVEEIPQGKTARDLKRECLDYAEFRENLEARLIEITRYFAVVRRFEIDLASTKISFDEMIKDASEWHPIPTPEWLAAYRSKVLEESGLLEVDLDIELAKAFEPSPAFPDVAEFVAYHIPGKHLLPGILRYLGIRANFDFSKLNKALYVRLLNHVSAEIFGVLKIRLLRGHPDLLNFQ